MEGRYSENGDRFAYSAFLNYLKESLNNEDLTYSKATQITCKDFPIEGDMSDILSKVFSSVIEKENPSFFDISFSYPLSFYNVGNQYYEFYKLYNIMSSDYPKTYSILTTNLFFFTEASEKQLADNLEMARQNYSELERAGLCARHYSNNFTANCSMLMAEFNRVNYDESNSTGPLLNDSILYTTLLNNMGNIEQQI